jgi:hypothetical protein
MQQLLPANGQQTLVILNKGRTILTINRFDYAYYTILELQGTAINERLTNPFSDPAAAEAVEYCRSLSVGGAFAARPAIPVPGGTR